MLERTKLPRNVYGMKRLPGKNNIDMEIKCQQKMQGWGHLYICNEMPDILTGTCSASHFLQTLKYSCYN